MKTILAVLTLLIVSQAEAALTPGEFVLGTDPQEFQGTSACAVRTRLRLDQGQVIGKVARFEEYLEGFCKIAVRPNPRFFNLTKIGSQCGSEIYYGEGYDSLQGYHQVTITDHRNRQCEDVVPAPIVVEDVTQDHKDLLYSLEKPRDVSCMAYWEGYVVNPENSSCIHTSMSACRNPFRFPSLESCEAGLKRGEAKIPNL